MEKTIQLEPEQAADVRLFVGMYNTTAERAAKLEEEYRAVADTMSNLMEKINSILKAASEAGGLDLAKEIQLSEACDALTGESAEAADADPDPAE